MAKFNFKTRGTPSPQGKQKVYFCAHPSEYRVYFDRVTKEILDTLEKNGNRSCAIWYLDDPEIVRDEEFFSELEGMSLFIMPVTTKLLTTANPALDVEFRYALEHHIPVLPLMMESGLDELFGRKCGDMQYLDSNCRDATAIPYEEKLTKYLTSVLIGDELAEKIRKAFDAYIFLSYRKKDRKYAQELMRLIHKNDFCRDIAIWYDEFLIPGENFNKAIEAALEKSRLFAMAVTPSLLEKTVGKDGIERDNYIVQVEYPMAQRAEKPILPAELVGTDKESLSAKYPGIPGCIDGRDGGVLSAALADALKDIAIRENDGDHEHNFLIGLAYLGGIDVETDHKKAIDIITECADVGLPEAIEKLVSMYRTGEAVERDYEKAIEWQRKLVYVRKQKYEESGDEDDAIEYLDSLWYLGDYICELGKLDGAESVYREMLSESKVMHVRYAKNWTGRSVSVSYENLGDIRSSRGDLDGAEKYYTESLNIREELARETGSVVARSDLSVSYERLGDICTSRGDLDGAEKYYTESLKIVENLAHETGTPKARRDLSVSYERLGDIRTSRGDLDGAEEYYTESLKITEELARETETVESYRDLSISCEKLGNIRTLCGDLDGAEEYYNYVLKIAEYLALEMGTVEARRDLSVSYNKLGDICSARGDLGDAEKYYTESLNIREELARETGTVEARRDLAISYGNLGDIRSLGFDLEVAEEHYIKSAKIFEDLARETGTPQARRDLSVSYDKLGDIRSSHSDLDGAEKYYTESLKIAEDLARETGTLQARRDLSVSYERLGNISNSRGDLDGAEDHYTKFLKIAKELARETGTSEDRRNLSISYNRLGDICSSRGDIDCAENYYTKFLKIAEYLARETETPEDRRNLSISYNNLGDIRSSRGDIDGAEKYYTESVNIREELARETGTVEAYDDLAVSYYKCSTVISTERDAYLRGAINIYIALCKAYPSVERYHQNLEMLRSELEECGEDDNSTSSPARKTSRIREFFRKLFGKLKK